MNRFLTAALALPLILTAPSALAGEGAAYFISPENGAAVSSPVTVRMGLRGMGVAPAGTEKEGTGHHHILVDRAPWGQGDGDAEAARNGLPADDHHKHFGGGQTETQLELAPGEHTLQLVLGDAFHVPHDPAVVSEVITITVK